MQTSRVLLLNFCNKMDTDIRVCCECDKQFCSIFNLRRHARKRHPDKINLIAPHKQWKYPCKHCNRRFNHLSNFKYHKKKHHTSPNDLQLPKHKCSLCQLQAPKAELIVHFKVDHDIEITTDILEFSTFEEFLDWKKNTEIETRSRFVKERGKYTTNIKTLIHYNCHRSGNFISQGKRKRNLKVQGTNKIDGFCPASIKIEIDNNKRCKVFFANKHVGHANDLDHLSLTVDEKELLAEKMALKIPFSEILEQVRGSVQDSSELQRIHLVNRRDLHNIKKYLKRKSTVQDQNNTISVETCDTESFDCLSREKEKLKSEFIPHLIKIIENITCMEQVDALKELCASTKSTIKAIDKKQKDIVKLEPLSE